MKAVCVAGKRNYKVSSTQSENKYVYKQITCTKFLWLYFPLDAVHVSDYISPSSRATL
jgi:hypothetical protein